MVLFMLQTSGVSDSLLIPSTRILEPSCGQGEFVIAIAKELCLKLKSLDSKKLVKAERFKYLVAAYDISNDSIEIAKTKTYQILKSVFEDSDAAMLVAQWYKNDDFLLIETKSLYTHVIGNPPYVRIENIPAELLTAYRSKFFTMIERADLYVAFFEKSLSLLEEKGVLSFICTDRWTKNSYGSSLRNYVAASYQLDLFVDMYGQNAFQSDVLTYPAITQISKRKHVQTLIIHNPTITVDFSNLVARSLAGDKVTFEGKNIRKDVVNGAKPWTFGSFGELALIKRLEQEFPLIEDTNCQIFIGAATGNNKVYMVDNKLDIEPSRRLPMVEAKDISSGILIDSGLFIINTYDDNGVIDLDDFPKLKAYLEVHSKALKSRHVAKNNPVTWFRTIDRVHPSRVSAEKLLIPDIKSQLTVVYDNGEYHPNNTIYYVTSNSWSLKALQAVLISGLGQLFVEIYSTKISGGNLRFQAQHLRRIRLPLWESVPDDLRDRLEDAAVDKNVAAAKELVFDLYNFTEKERQVLGC
ncbi:hypothetical protein BCU68_07350 [Vibrio sp. 10N.286.49.B3]|nr:hypothetical protein BCU68_07350 [Vibrio sp. 10N.286.49.B3]